MRFGEVVGRIEWKVLHDVEKARGSWGGRGACDSVLRGFPPYRHCQIIQMSVEQALNSIGYGCHLIN